MDRALIAEIVKQVVAQLRAAAPSRRVLSLFSGASTGFVAGMEAIKVMTAGGHQVTVVFTPSAVNIITAEHARKAGATNIILPDQWVDAPSLAQNCDLVLVPTLSMNTAARLALGLMDNLITTLVMGALLAGKPVLAIRDGADPYGSAGRVFGTADGVAINLKNKLTQNLDALTSFGIELIDEANFLATVEARLIGINLMANQTVLLSQSPARQPLPVFMPAPAGGTPLITQHDLLPLAPGSSITVPPEARFTPLAQDTVKQLRLNVITL